MERVKKWLREAYMDAPEAIDGGSEDGEATQNYVQWMTSDNTVFFPASRNVKKLFPGLYEVRSSISSGMFFEKVALGTEDLIKFPDTESETVIAEIEKFWEQENKFEDQKLAYKRGILLYGPPGSGKTCTIKMILEDIIKRGGVAIKFNDPHTFTGGMKILREIQDDTPVVVLMEDLDSILSYNCESSVINVLDGVDNINKCVFLATTNYPEKLGSRVMNRPSRFDKRFLIGMPSNEARKIYFDAKLKGKEKDDIDKWVKDTDGMSIAHLKELVIAVTILDNEYDEAVETLKEMKKKVDSDEWDDFGKGEAISRRIKEKKLAMRKKADQLEGGLADDIPAKDFDQEQLKIGTEEEAEHTKDEELAREIAKDHLAEDPDYYKKLKEMEEKEASITSLVRKCSSGWNSPLLPGKFFSKRSSLTRVLNKNG